MTYRTKKTSVDIGLLSSEQQQVQPQQVSIATVLQAAMHLSPAATHEFDFTAPSLEASCKSLLWFVRSKPAL